MSLGVLIHPTSFNFFSQKPSDILPRGEYQVTCVLDLGVGRKGEDFTYLPSVYPPVFSPGSLLPSLIPTTSKSGISLGRWWPDWLLPHNLLSGVPGSPSAVNTLLSVFLLPEICRNFSPIAITLSHPVRCYEFIPYFIPSLSC